jgi:hypothetical protein
MNPPAAKDFPEETAVALRQLLAEYLDAVKRQKETNPPDLLALFTRLDGFEQSLGKESPSALRHYMAQKSYRKAYEFLAGPNP